MLADTLVKSQCEEKASVTLEVKNAVRIISRITTFQIHIKKRSGCAVIRVQFCEVINIADLYCRRMRHCRTYYKRLGSSSIFAVQRILLFPLDTKHQIK